MKVITHTVLLIALHLTVAKIFDECEFANELYDRHQIPREDIYKHFCIASSLHTAKNGENGYKGIYAIGSKWWCGKDAPGGGCNVKCSELLDDDIADDVTCANLILSQQGLTGWGKSEKACQRYEQKAEECLGPIEMLIGLMGNESDISTTIAAPTTTVMTTIMPTTTENQSQNYSSEDHHVTDFQSSPHQTLNASSVQCSCATQNILLTIIVVALVFAIAAVLFKYRNLKQIAVFVQNKEYEEHLIS
ncbi:lysozyme C-like [Bradysia coprophila]|uniref:lysozyme C-like n=1 Tax=Bradysia coprophila TaxID=38358 RepID=UPI00187D8AD7|nr:lysozyme C-like [Bradysia coprophila]